MHAPIEVNDDAFVVDAALLGELLALPAQEVPVLMRDKAITSICERGIEEDAGAFRLSFFFRGRRARLSVDTAGRILRRSVIDYGERPMPGAAHRAGG